VFKINNLYDFSGRYLPSRIAITKKNGFVALHKNTGEMAGFALKNVEPSNIIRPFFNLFDSQSLMRA